MEKKSFQWKGFDVRLTCECFPEQYDVYRQGKITGYIRVRHGMAWAFCPDAGIDSECVYESVAGYGEFHNEQERKYHMDRIMDAINTWYRKNRNRK